MRTSTFFDVRVQGISGGSATVSVSYPNGGPETKMEYWDQGIKAWKSMNPSYSNGIISGTIDVNKLQWTPIVIGT